MNEVQLTMADLRNLLNIINRVSITGAEAVGVVQLQQKILAMIQSAAGAAQEPTGHDVT
jgi:hypothetical protein